ncbi:MAG: hypothetical protein KDH09_16905, partial [Chrysiogenetes bacterium]|nr:hypothetical protein [Chrysiogenetes bacterium]
ETLRPIAAVAFRRSVALAAGDELNFTTLPDGTSRLDRVCLPVRLSRALPIEARSVFHGHQLLAIAEALSYSPAYPDKALAWPEAAELEGRILAEWPGYRSRLARAKSFEDGDRLLYPALTVRLLTEAEPVESEDVKSSGQGEEITGSESTAREQNRLNRTEDDRGLRIERAESEEEMTRRWAGEKRDEMASSGEEEPPPGPMDLVRTRTPVLHAVKTESTPALSSPGEGGIRYDEWDAGQGSYRRRYCQVFPETPRTHGDARSNRVLEGLATRRQVVREVIRLFDSLRPIPRRVGRQPDGDSIDLDAFVDQSVQMRLGGSMSENLYEQHIRMDRSVAVTLLIDVSASTEQWLGHRRAFEIGMESAALFAMGQRVLGDEVEILGFSGSGPGNVRIVEFKRFEEQWTDEVFARMDACEPQAFTRLGAALRHASAALQKRACQHKLLLILSDARPQDEDGYEGSYALADTRRALDEARRAGIIPYCLTLDREVGPQLKLLFRQHHAIHLNPETLPLKLPQVFAALTRHD